MEPSETGTAGAEGRDEKGIDTQSQIASDVPARGTAGN